MPLSEQHSHDDFFAPNRPWSAGAARLADEAREAFPENAEYASPRMKYLIDASNLVASKQAFEAGWVGQRMSWLVISQSFLFSAFATAAQRDLPVLIVLKWIVPLMGLVQAIATQVSIISARMVDSELYKTRSVLDVALRLFAPGMKQLPPLGDVRAGRTYRSRWRGALSSQILPSTLVAAWTLLLAILILIHFAPNMMDWFLGLSPK